MSYDYERIHARRDASVLFATIDNPPINLLSLQLYAELGDFTVEVENDPDVRVLVLQSANPDFFIAHFDVEAILDFPVDTEPRLDEELNPFHAMCERLRTMPKATIAKVAGRVGGGGSELVSSCDMRFAALGRARVNQMEVALGILPGGSGTQRLPRLLGRGRALEVILGSDDLDAETGAAWGYFNRAMPPAELDLFVDRLAHRIASFPAEAIALAKESVGNAELPIEEGLRREAYLFQQTLRTTGARRNMRRFLELGGQTRIGELRVGELALESARED